MTPLACPQCHAGLVPDPGATPRLATASCCGLLYAWVDGRPFRLLPAGLSRADLGGPPAAGTPPSADPERGSNRATPVA